MLTYGMYYYSGNWVHDIGGPAESGVGVDLVLRHCAYVRGSRLSEQIFRVDKWSLCRG
jgi:hypothetical protein